MVVESQRLTSGHPVTRLDRSGVAMGLVGALAEGHEGTSYVGTYVCGYVDILGTGRVGHLLELGEPLEPGD